MMRSAALVSLVAAAVVLVFPAITSAGWAGSPYEKSQCTLFTQTGRPFLTCERTFTQVVVHTDVFTVADSSCASGQRLMRREQTVEETWRVFDFFDGPVPLAQFIVGGNEVPISSRLISDVTAPLGCAP